MKNIHPQIILPIVLAFPAIIVSFFFDEEILDFFRFFHNPFLDKIMHWFAEAESMFFILIVMALLFMIEIGKTRWLTPLLLSSATATILAYIGKFIFMRRRPFGDIGFLGVMDSSFPSAHATIAFACATILYREFPRVGWFFYIFAIVVAIGRVYLQKHYLSDVIAGSVLGYFIGYTILWIFHKYIFKDCTHKKSPSNT